MSELFRNISWMQQRAIHRNDEELLVALSDRGLPLSAGRTMLLTEKKKCVSQLLRNIIKTEETQTQKTFFSASALGRTYLQQVLTSNMTSSNSNIDNNEQDLFFDAAPSPDSVFSSAIESVLSSHYAEHSLSGDEQSKVEANATSDEDDVYISDEAQTETNETNHVGSTKDANNIFFNQEEFESLRHLMPPQYQSDYEDEHSLFGDGQLIESFFSESEFAESPPPQFYTEEQIFLIPVDVMQMDSSNIQLLNESIVKRSRCI